MKHWNSPKRNLLWGVWSLVTGANIILFTIALVNNISFEDVPLWVSTLMFISYMGSAGGITAMVSFWQKTDRVDLRWLARFGGLSLTIGGIGLVCYDLLIRRTGQLDWLLMVGIGLVALALSWAQEKQPVGPEDL